MPNETPKRRWGTISMDFIMPLPKSEGFTAVLVVVDRLTKMAHFISTRRDITATKTAEELMKHVFKIHGLPDKIILDRGSQFAANVIREMYNKLNITIALSSTYHPQTDGQTERVNQDLETYLRMFINHRQNDWAKWLHLAKFAYNNRQHSTTKVSPFMANNLTQPRWTLEGKFENMTHPAAKEHLKEMKETEKELKVCLDLTVEKMKELYDKGDILNFKEGELVFLDARNLKEKNQTRDEPTKAMTRKLRKKRVGPYKILKKLSELSYQLELPKELEEKGVHDVFHISLLTKAPKDTIEGRRPVQPPPLIIDDEEELEVEEVINSRLKNRQLQYLVKWKGTTDEENSWEKQANLKNAPLAVKEFHEKHPEAPRKINGTFFNNIRWQKLENYTSLAEKKERTQQILKASRLLI